jgi:hypothetical protein
MAERINRRTFIGTTTSLVAGVGLVRLRAREAAGERLSASERRILRAAADGIIPAEGRMPAASKVGAAEYIEALAAGDAEFHATVTAALTALGASFARGTPAERTTALARLEAMNAAAFAALRDAVYEAYYTHPRVWNLLGARFRRGPRRTAPVEAFDEARLARVRQLPRLYRETT